MPETTQFTKKNTDQILVLRREPLPAPTAVPVLVLLLALVLVLVPVTPHISSRNSSRTSVNSR